LFSFVCYTRPSARDCFPLQFFDERGFCSPSFSFSSQSPLTFFFSRPNLFPPCAPVLLPAFFFYENVEGLALPLGCLFFQSLRRTVIAPVLSPVGKARCQVFLFPQMLHLIPPPLPPALFLGPPPLCLRRYRHFPPFVTNKAYPFALKRLRASKGVWSSLHARSVVPPASSDCRLDVFWFRNCFPFLRPPLCPPWCRLFPPSLFTRLLPFLK